MSNWYIASEENLVHLTHHGILGQKWGIRRYQNEDGSLTEEGRRRYSKSLYKQMNKIDREYTKNVKDSRNFQYGTEKAKKKYGEIVDELEKNIGKIDKSTNVEDYVNNLINDKYGNKKYQGMYDGLKVKEAITNMILERQELNEKREVLEKEGYDYNDEYEWYEKKLKNGQYMMIEGESGNAPSKTLIDVAKDYEKNSKQHDRVVKNALAKYIKERNSDLGKIAISTIISKLEPAGVSIQDFDGNVYGEISFYDPTYYSHWLTAEYDFKKKKPGHISVDG